MGLCWVAFFLKKRDPCKDVSANLSLRFTGDPKLRNPFPWFGHGCPGHRLHLEHERNYGLGMYAPVAVCSWSTNGVMIWAWMLWSPYALGTRTEFWFGHGCSGRRMLLEHERNYGLGMDALVIECFWNTNGNFGLGMDALDAVCSWNTNGILVWAWML